jgi:hypothetical protein
VALEREEVAHRARAQRRVQARLADLAPLTGRGSGLDEGDHVAVEAEVDNRAVLERPDPGPLAGLVGNQLHAAALLTAARIFT